MEERKTRKIEVSEIGHLPSKWQIHSPFYLDKNHPLFINDEIKKRIAVIESLDSQITTGSTHAKKNPLYVIYFGQGHYPRLVMRYFKNQNDQDTPLVFAKCESLKLIQDIYGNSKKSISTGTSNELTETNRSLAEGLLVDAMKLGASDFHLESDGQGAIMRFRVHKELIDWKKLTHNEALDFGTVCFQTFVTSGDEEGTGKGIYQPTNLLEGEFSVRIGDEYSVKARLVNLSHNRGEKFDLIARIIDRNKSGKTSTFEDLGFSSHSCNLLRSLDNASSGAIFTLGVTGSGKSVSQSSMMQHERDRSGGSRKIISLEHPVEYEMDRISQITVGDKPIDGKSSLDFSFDNLNKYLLRSDPDSLGYGEIRDAESAHAAVKGVETGHLCYGTLHTDSAISVFSRLRSLGLKVEDICRKGFLNLVLFQSLLPKICPHCSHSYKIGDDIPDKYDEMFALKAFSQTSGGKITFSNILPIQNSLKPGESLLRASQREGIVTARDVVKLREKLRYMNKGSDNEAFRSRLMSVIEQSDLTEDEIDIRFRGQGCEKCFHGQKGVAPASEVLIPDATILDYVRNGEMNKAEVYWKTALGGRSATVDSYEKILSGIVDPRSVEQQLLSKLGE